MVRRPSGHICGGKSPLFAIGVGHDARRFRDRSKARSAQNELDGGLTETTEITCFTSVPPHFGQVCAFSRSA
jgi:hypothetical protein